MKGGKGCQKDYVNLYWGRGEGTHKFYCGKAKKLKKGLKTEASEEDYEFWFDFYSDGRKNGNGFKCFVSGEAQDGGANPTTSAPTEPTTAAPTEPPTTSGPSGNTQHYTELCG